MLYSDQQGEDLQSATEYDSYPTALRLVGWQVWMLGQQISGVQGDGGGVAEGDGAWVERVGGFEGEREIVVVGVVTRGERV